MVVYYRLWCIIKIMIRSPGSVTSCCPLVDIVALQYMTISVDVSLLVFQTHVTKGGCQRQLYVGVSVAAKHANVAWSLPAAQEEVPRKYLFWWEWISDLDCFGQARRALGGERLRQLAIASNNLVLCTHQGRLSMAVR